MLKNSLTLAVFLLMNLFIKLGFVSVNVPRETYFVDKLRTHLRRLLTKSWQRKQNLLRDSRIAELTKKYQFDNSSY